MYMYNLNVYPPPKIKDFKYFVDTIVVFMNFPEHLAFPGTLPYSRYTVHVTEFLSCFWLQGRSQCFIFDG